MLAQNSDRVKFQLNLFDFQQIFYSLWLAAACLSHLCSPGRQWMWMQSSSSWTTTINCNHLFACDTNIYIFFFFFKNEKTFIAIRNVIWHLYECSCVCVCVRDSLAGAANPCTKYFTCIVLLIQLCLDNTHRNKTVSFELFVWHTLWMS